MTAGFIALGPRRTKLASALAVLGLVVCASTATGATGWTGPRLVGPAGNCGDVTAAIDAGGGYHVVAECDGTIRYSSSRPDGTWSTTSFAHPLSQTDHQPQVAIDGSVVYVAYTREQFAGCGFDWAGVYYRTRTLPGGTWSAAKLLGRAGDHLQSLRVVGGMIHATVDLASDFYEVDYETSSGGTLHRYPITDAVGLTSLRIGSDGRARIVYEAPTRFGTPCSTARASRSLRSPAPVARIAGPCWCWTRATGPTSSGPTSRVRAAPSAIPSPRTGPTTRPTRAVRGQLRHRAGSRPTSARSR